MTEETERPAETDDELAEDAAEGSEATPSDADTEPDEEEAPE